MALQRTPQQRAQEREGKEIGTRVTAEHIHHALGSTIETGREIRDLLGPLHLPRSERPLLQPPGPALERLVAKPASLFGATAVIVISASSENCQFFSALPEAFRPERPVAPQMFMGELIRQMVPILGEASKKGSIPTLEKLFPNRPNIRLGLNTSLRAMFCTYNPLDAAIGDSLNGYTSMPLVEWLYESMTEPLVYEVGYRVAGKPELAQQIRPLTECVMAGNLPLGRHADTGYGFFLVK